MSDRAVVVLGCEFSPDRMALGPGSVLRTNTGITLAEQQDALLIVAGGFPARWSEAPQQALATLMTEHAVQSGFQEDRIVTVTESRDTVGDALFTKKRTSMFDRLTVVTSDSHVERSLDVFRHVFGIEYDIQGESVSTPMVPVQGLQEIVGRLLQRSIFAGTRPGDHKAIQERLYKVMPGYEDRQVSSRLLSFVGGLAKSLYS